MTVLLDGFELPYGIDKISWTYRLRTVSQDTLGGRVIQVLGVHIDEMRLSARAGSRVKLLQVADKVASILAKQIETERPVQLLVDSKGWDFQVFLKQMPELGWRVETVSYPFELVLQIDEDAGLVSPTLLRDQLSKVATSIGYNRAWSGGDVSEQLLQYTWTDVPASMLSTSALLGLGNERQV